MAFDDILKYINDLAGQLNLEELLVEAECLYHTFLRICETSKGADLKEEVHQKVLKKNNDN